MSDALGLGYFLSVVLAGIAEAFLGAPVWVPVCFIAGGFVGVWLVVS